MYILISPLEGPSTVRRCYDDGDDDDNDLFFFELVKKRVSSIIVPENFIYVKLFILFYKIGGEVTKWVKII